MMNMTRPILEAVTQFFQQENWYYEVVVDSLESAVLRASYKGENGLLVCHAGIRDKQHQFIFCSSPFLFWVVPEYRKSVSEFLTRINYTLAIGCFDMDFDDGEVRFRTGIDVEGDRLTVALVRQVVYINVTAMDRYLPIIKLVAFGYIAPEQALHKTLCYETEGV